jgi:hypothetical protein
MRNLTFAEWAWVMIGLLTISNLAKVLELQTLDLVAAIALIALAAERFVNWRRLRRAHREVRD